MAVAISPLNCPFVPAGEFPAGTVWAWAEFLDHPHDAHVRAFEQCERDKEAEARRDQLCRDIAALPDLDAMAADGVMAARRRAIAIRRSLNPSKAKTFKHVPAKIAPRDFKG